MPINTAIRNRVIYRCSKTRTRIGSVSAVIAGEIFLTGCIIRRPYRTFAWSVLTVAITRYVIVLGIGSGFGSHAKKRNKEGNQTITHLVIS